MHYISYNIKQYNIPWALKLTIYKCSGI